MWQEYAGFHFPVAFCLYPCNVQHAHARVCVFNLYVSVSVCELESVTSLLPWTSLRRWARPIWFMWLRNLPPAAQFELGVLILWTVTDILQTKPRVKPLKLCRCSTIFFFSPPPLLFEQLVRIEQQKNICVISFELRALQLRWSRFTEWSVRGIYMVKQYSKISQTPFKCCVQGVERFFSLFFFLFFCQFTL